MKDRMRNIFDQLHAEAALRAKTEAFIRAELYVRKKRNHFSRFRQAVVLTLFGLSIIVGRNVYFTPSAYVDIDVNPSVEFAVNRFNRVIAATPYNEDGRKLFEEIHVQHRSYDSAVRELLTVMDRDGYLEEVVYVTVQTPDTNRGNEIVNDLQTIVDVALGMDQSTIATNIFSVSADVKMHAKENQVSPAKYLAITELQKLDSFVTFESCRHHSIGELHKLVEEHRGSHHSTSERNKDESSNPSSDAETEKENSGKDESNSDSKESPAQNHSHRRGRHH